MENMKTQIEAQTDIDYLENRAKNELQRGNMLAYNKYRFLLIKI